VDKVLQNILRCAEVKRVTGLPRSSLYAKIASGEFPKPIPLGVRARGWLEQDVLAWQQARTEARDAKAA
jgi:prophage regulatory protein